jgi:predicted phosphodiesterase
MEGMKIQVISDLHQEFGFMDISFDNADLVILAGDINLGTKGIEWIKSTILLFMAQPFGLTLLYW